MEHVNSVAPAINDAAPSGFNRAHQKTLFVVAGGTAKRGAAALYAHPTGGSPIRIYGPELPTGSAVAISPEVP